MTSEVCVMNRFALVLAADSAVTVSRWENGEKEERYFKGANKIFQLSEAMPVGLMIFDSADLHKIPWEIIVKEFRAKLGGERCGTLADYASKFFNFLASSLTFFPDEYRQKIFVQLIDRGMVRSIQIVNADPRVKEATTDELANAAREVALAEMLSLLEKMPIDVDLTQDDIDGLITLTEADLTKEATINLEHIAKKCTYPISDLIKIGAYAVFKVPESYLPTTGIVVAGYGDNDYFPSYVEYLCQGLIGNKLLTKSTKEMQITPESYGHIDAFAMTAMVDTFYLGFSPDVLRSVKDELRNSLLEMGTKLAAQNGGGPLNGLEAIIDETIASHTSAWTTTVFDKHAHPFRRVIGSLPIDEMASLAETLVMLESLKEKVTKPSESVGGPIDVAVITKSEGFLWIKRKHFFDPKLNPRYFQRQGVFPTA